MPKFINPTKVITGPDARWSYANIWEAKSINGGAPKFSVSLIIPKSDTRTVEKIKVAIEAAYKEGESKLKGNGRSVPALSAIKNPLRDGRRSPPETSGRPAKIAIIRFGAMAPPANRNPARPPHPATPQPLPVSWTQTAILFWSVARFTAVFTAERLFLFMLLTPTATRVSPAV